MVVGGLYAVLGGEVDICDAGKGVFDMDRIDAMDLVMCSSWTFWVIAAAALSLYLRLE